MLAEFWRGQEMNNTDWNGELFCKCCPIFSCFHVRVRVICGVIISMSNGQFTSVFMRKLTNDDRLLLFEVFAGNLKTF